MGMPARPGLTRVGVLEPLGISQPLLDGSKCRFRTWIHLCPASSVQKLLDKLEAMGSPVSLRKNEGERTNVWA